MTATPPERPDENDEGRPDESARGRPDEDERGAAASARTCSHCGDAFPSEQLRDLHRGLEHYDALDAGEREAFDDAYVAESEDLQSFRLRALAALVLLYFFFLFTYAVVTVG